MFEPSLPGDTEQEPARTGVAAHFLPPPRDGSEGVLDCVVEVRDGAAETAQVLQHDRPVLAVEVLELVQTRPGGPWAIQTVRMVPLGCCSWNHPPCGIRSSASASPCSRTRSKVVATRNRSSSRTMPLDAASSPAAAAAIGHCAACAMSSMPISPITLSSSSLSGSPPTALPPGDQGDRLTKNLGEPRSDRVARRRRRGRGASGAGRYPLRGIVGRDGRRDGRTLVRWSAIGARQGAGAGVAECGLRDGSHVAVVDGCAR